MIAIVLVGGKGSLLNDHPDLPNSLVHVAGEPFLFWLSYWLKSLGVTHIVYSAGHHAEKIEAWANHFANIEPSLCLDVVTESRPLGTAGAAALCAKRFPSTFTFIVNGDSILLAPIQPAIQRLMNNSDTDGIIFGTNVTNAGRFGTLEVDNTNRLLAFKEKKPGNGAINAGVYLLRNELLSEVISGKEHSLEYDCFPQWVNEHKHIHVMDTPAPFIDVGTPEALKRAEKLIHQYQGLITGYKEELIA
jgi:D-glycero-alpha-D-manno-heptose 1-phosphate guanylyltransferase